MIKDMPPKKVANRKGTVEKPIMPPKAYLNRLITDQEDFPYILSSTSYGIYLVSVSYKHLTLTTNRLV